MNGISTRKTGQRTPSMGANLGVDGRRRLVLTRANLRSGAGWRFCGRDQNSFLRLEGHYGCSTLFREAESPRWPDSDAFTRLILGGFGKAIFFQTFQAFSFEHRFGDDAVESLHFKEQLLIEQIHAKMVAKKSAAPSTTGHRTPAHRDIVPGPRFNLRLPAPTPSGLV
ncbi:MAG: hypothetical protein LAQ69_26055 [Acidobacteriia bacterium]|nr:hypothetical protein [Terriglobia bacterium]